MSSSQTDEILTALAADGHAIHGGMCEKCWQVAATLYANGQGAYESHTDAYHEVIKHVWEKAALTTREAP